MVHLLTHVLWCRHALSLLLLSVFCSCFFPLLLAAAYFFSSLVFQFALLAKINFLQNRKSNVNVQRMKASELSSGTNGTFVT